MKIIRAIFAGLSWFFRAMIPEVRNEDEWHDCIAPDGGRRMRRRVGDGWQYREMTPEEDREYVSKAAF